MQGVQGHIRDRFGDSPLDQVGVVNVSGRPVNRADHDFGDTPDATHYPPGTHMLGVNGDGYEWNHTFHTARELPGAAADLFDTLDLSHMAGDPDDPDENAWWEQYQDHIRYLRAANTEGPASQAQIPADLRREAAQWHAGQWGGLYALQSGGYITPANLEGSLQELDEARAHPAYAEYPDAADKLDRLYDLLLDAKYRRDNGIGPDD